MEIDEIELGRAQNLRDRKFGRLKPLYRVANKNGKTMWKCRCDCGTIKDIGASNLTSGITTSCGCLQKELASQKYKDITNVKFGMVVALSPTEKRDSCGGVIWKCLCDCGNEFFASAHNLQANHNLSCGCNKYKIKDISGKKFGRLIAISPTNKRTSGRGVIWNCQCDCGRQKEVSELSLIRGATKSCGCLSDLSGQTFGKLSVIKSTNFRTNTGNRIYECQCECGNICKVSGNNLLQGNTISCGCLRESKGEYVIKKILQSKNLLFEQEKKFDTCRFPDTNALARFDFYVNNSYLIEYDGSQHFDYRGSGWNTEENLKQTKNHDNFKNQWCKENNIPLIRIPYTHLKNLSIEDLLLETSQFIVKDDVENEL